MYCLYFQQIASQAICVFQIHIIFLNYIIVLHNVYRLHNKL